MRKHGKQNKRRRKKFHMGICPISHEILVEETTELEIADCQNSSYDAEKTSQDDQEGHRRWGQ